MARPRPARSPRRRRRVVLNVAAVAILALFVAPALDGASSRGAAQSEVGDAELEGASGGRVVRVGALANGNGVTTLPLEVYVGRVLAGEGEPKAPVAAQQALAVAIRTFALANVDRHAREGFDLCDTTHCQVPRAATAASRRAGWATAGQYLMYDGGPAEVFYSASCGGRSEDASAVWPAAGYPYLRSVRDGVHEDDRPWTLELTLRDIQQALGRVGFAGERLRDVRIEARSVSGRAARMRLRGLQPDVIGGDQFRAAIGATTLRSTAFSISKRGSTVRFTGSGFGHGVGMCVIGAGRLAARGEDVRAILARYYPGLTIGRVEAAVAPVGAKAVEDRPERPPVPATDAPAAAPRPTAAIVAHVPSSSAMSASEVERVASQAHDELSRLLGASAVPFTIRLHDSLESFRRATGRPWWVGTVADGRLIDLAPAAVLSLREGVEVAVRTAVAELLVSPALAGRPAWVRVGAARHFAGRAPAAADRATRPPAPRCPSNAELGLAVSAAAQRDAEARAEACFAREYARTGDWRTVR